MTTGKYDAKLEEERDASQEQKPGKLVLGAYEWAESLILACVFVSVIFTFFVRVITVDGDSMNPNYINDDRVMVTSINPSIEQGDVVIIMNISSIDGPIIKRVIATEGQTVDFDPVNKAVLVDGAPVDDSAFGIQNGITELYWSDHRMLDFPQTVPDGCVFVLGDNRTLSKDSRFESVGMIDKRNILGKAILYLFPVDRIGRTV